MDVVAAINEQIEQALPMAFGMGVRVVAAGPGTASALVPAEGNTNHIGTMYAGVLFTVAEVLGGALCGPSFGERCIPIVKNLRIDFRKPAFTAVTATASLTEGQVARTRETLAERGKADFELLAELRDEAGVVVATTVGTYQVRNQ